MNRPSASSPYLLPASAPALPRRRTALGSSSVRLLSASLLASLAAPSLWALQPALIRGNNVNVRGRASTSGEVLFKLNEGDPVQVVDTVTAAGAKKGAPSRWAQIQLPASVPVYVNAAFLNGDTVAATKLNIRGGPGENYSVLGSLQRGAKIQPLGNKGAWVQISPTSETYAFIAADYVIETGAPSPDTNAVATAVAATSPIPPVPAEAAAPNASLEVPAVPASSGTVLVMDDPPLSNPAQTPPASPGENTPPTADNPSYPPLAPAPNTNLIAKLEPAREEHPRNRFTFGYRFGLNTSAEFDGFSGFAGTSGSVDGYVLPSSRQTGGPTPAPDGRTWNWGYNNPSQVQNNNLLVTKSTVPASNGSHSVDNGNTVSGIELTYAHELWAGGASKFCHIGIEAAFNYSSLNTESTWAHSVPLVRNISAYALGGVVPPYDPYSTKTYQGTYYGPGPTIPMVGSNQTVIDPEGATMTSYRQMDASNFGLRFGPYLESPIYKRLWGNVGAGMAIGMVQGEFRYSDTYAASTVSGSATDFRALLGWYIGGGLSYKLSHYWGIFYNAQYQQLPDYTLNAGNVEAKLKAGNGLFQSIGISYSF
jgi:hypothetical protein